MAELKVYKVVNSLPAVLELNTIYYVRSGNGFEVFVTSSIAPVIAHPYNKHGDETINQHSDVSFDFINSSNGDEFVNIDGVLVKKPRPIIIESPDGSWQTSTNDIDTPITDPNDPNTNIAGIASVDFTEAGLWKPYISFLHSADSTGTDFQAELRLDNISIVKANPTSARLLKIENKDSAGENPDYAGARTSQILDFGMKFHAFNVAVPGPQNLVFLFGPENQGTEANIAEITIEFHRVYNVIKMM